MIPINLIRFAYTSILILLVGMYFIQNTSNYIILENEVKIRLKNKTKNYYTKRIIINCFILLLISTIVLLLFKSSLYSLLLNLLIIVFQTITFILLCFFLKEETINIFF